MSRDDGVGLDRSTYCADSIDPGTFGFTRGKL